MTNIPKFDFHFRRASLLATIAFALIGTFTGCRRSQPGDVEWAALQTSGAFEARNYRAYSDFARKFPKHPNAKNATTIGIKLEVEETRETYEAKK